MPGCSPRSFVYAHHSARRGQQRSYASSNAQLIATPLVASSVGRWRLAGPATLAGALADRPQPSQIQPRPPERPRLLIPMYVSFAALQAMDAHSTMKAIDRGYGEVNPLVAPSTRNGAAMAAMKVAVTASVIACTERLWRHNRVAAVVTMIAVNGAYAAIVANNYRTASR